MIIAARDFYRYSEREQLEASEKHGEEKEREKSTVRKIEYEVYK